MALTATTANILWRPAGEEAAIVFEDTGVSFSPEIEISNFLPVGYSSQKAFEPCPWLKQADLQNDHDSKAACFCTSCAENTKRPQLKQLTCANRPKETFQAPKETKQVTRRVRNSDPQYWKDRLRKIGLSMNAGRKKREVCWDFNTMAPDQRPIDKWAVAPITLEPPANHNAVARIENVGLQTPCRPQMVELWEERQIDPVRRLAQWMIPSQWLYRKPSRIEIEVSESEGIPKLFPVSTFRQANAMARALLLERNTDIVCPCNQCESLNLCAKCEQLQTKQPKQPKRSNITLPDLQFVSRRYKWEKNLTPTDPNFMSPEPAAWLAHWRQDISEYEREYRSLPERRLKLLDNGPEEEVTETVLDKVNVIREVSGQRYEGVLKLVCRTWEVPLTWKREGNKPFGEQEFWTHGEVWENNGLIFTTLPNDERRPARDKKYIDDDDILELVVPELDASVDQLLENAMDCATEDTPNDPDD